MNRMRNTITALVFCLLTVLSGAGLVAAAEAQDDEKITMPKAPPAPPVPGRVLPSEETPVPTPVIPERSGTVIIVPPTPEQRGIVPPPSGTSPSDKIAPVEVPVIPVLPDKTTPVEIPVIPVLPQVPDRTTVLTPALQQETPQKGAIAPYSASPTPEPPAVLEPGKQPSPMDFLPMPTILDPEKTQREPKAKKDKQPTPAKDKQPSKARPEEPKPQTPMKAEQTKPEPGDPLNIPCGTAQTGDLSFLEGHWRVIPTRPMAGFSERYSFDKNGNGKIDQRSRNNECAGSIKAGFDAQGRLVVASERVSCSRSRWRQSYLVCECMKDNSTFCSARQKLNDKEYNKAYIVRE
jgi:hypothetical protein